MKAFFQGRRVSAMLLLLTAVLFARSFTVQYSQTQWLAVGLCHAQTTPGAATLAEALDRIAPDRVVCRPDQGGQRLLCGDGPG